MAPGSRPERAARAAIALALFMLGATISLLALVGRLGQEVQGRVLADLWQPLTRDAAQAPSSLPAMTVGLDTTAQQLVAVGWVLGVATAALGGLLWQRLGKPALPHERTWTSLAAWTTGWLLVGLLAAALYPGANGRIALLLASLLLALAGFIGLVLRLVQRSLRGA